MLSPKQILIAVFCSALLLSGCGSPLTKGNVRIVGSSQEQRAAKLVTRGDYGGAAFLYERIARNQAGARRIDTLLKAADYYLLADDIRSARRVLQALGPVSTQQFPLYAIANAEVLRELDLNPLLVGARGQGASAADALIVLENPS